MGQPLSHRSRTHYVGERYRTCTLTGDPTTGAGSLLHRLLEIKQGQSTRRSVLEVGANRGEHLGFVKHAWDQYVMLDLTAPSTAVMEAWPSGARFVAGDAHSLPFSDAHFDRVVMTCVLHHLEDPEIALEELRRVTRPGGRVSILLPTDPGLAYRAVRAMTSGLMARKAGRSEAERLSHAREHRNHYASLLVLVRSVFRKDAVMLRPFPTGLPSWNLNLVSIIQVTRLD